MRSRRGTSVWIAARVRTARCLAGLAGFGGSIAPTVLSAAAEVAPIADVAERVFVERLEALLAAQQWTEAARHIQQVSAIRPAPAWLAGREADVRWAQIRIGQAQRDLPGMVAAARLFLNGEDARSRRLLELARETQVAGDRPAALALVKEIVHRTPGFAPAQRVLAEWEPPVGESKRPVEKGPAEPPVSSRQKKTPAPEVDEATRLLAQLRTNRDAANVPAMLATARLFLTGERARSLTMLDVARESLGRNDRNTASLLTKEVLRRTPGFPPAQRLLVEIEAAEKP